MYVGTPGSGRHMKKSQKPLKKKNLKEEKVEQTNNTVNEIKEVMRRPINFFSGCLLSAASFA